MRRRPASPVGPGAGLRRGHSPRDAQAFRSRSARCVPHSGGCSDSAPTSGRGSGTGRAGALGSGIGARAHPARNMARSQTRRGALTLTLFRSWWDCRFSPRSCFDELSTSGSRVDSIDDFSLTLSSSKGERAFIDSPWCGRGDVDGFGRFMIGRTGAQPRARATRITPRTRPIDRMTRLSWSAVLTTTSKLLSAFLSGVLRTWARLMLTPTRADRLGDGGEQPGLVDADHLDGHRPQRRWRRSSQTTSTRRCGSLSSTRGQSTAWTVTPRPRVMKPRMRSPGKRVAALAEAHQHVLDAAHPHARPALAGDAAEELAQRALLARPARCQLRRREQLREHLARGDLAVADAGDQGFLVLDAERVQPPAEARRPCAACSRSRW